MPFSYKGLWKFLVSNEMKKMDLMEKTGLTSSAMARLGKNKPVNMDALERICVALKCDIGNVVKIASSRDADNKNGE